MFDRLFLSIPKVSDYYAYYRLFPKNVTAYRGVYDSFSSAMRAIPSDVMAGYSQPFISEHKSVAELTARSEIGVLHLIDYPVLFWLKSALADGPKLFELGGNVGLAYYAYSRVLKYPGGLRWLICEIPEVANAGRKLATEFRAKDLTFTTRFSEADGADIFLTSGTLQYLEETLPELLATLRLKPKHLLIQHVPFYEGETFTTLQNIGYAYCPYKIQNCTEFIKGLIALGYTTIDRWKIDRSCSIPFHPERFVPAYHGFYFRLKHPT